MSEFFRSYIYSDQIRVLKLSCDYSSRPWSFFIMFYVILILAAAGLPFILGRVVNISTRTEHQFETYTEATIWGDLSKSDIARAFTLTETTSASLPLFFWCQPGEPYIVEHRITMCAVGP